MLTRQHRIAAAAALAAAIVSLGSPANATSSVRDVSSGPVVCHPVTCTQERTVTTYTHGQPPLTLVQLRHRPVESRAFVKGLLPAWSRWKTVGVR